MKSTVNLSKFSSSNFMHAYFVKILPHQTFVAPYSITTTNIVTGEIINTCMDDHAL